jgi:hypothetical protein
MTSSRAPTLFALRKATRTGTSTLVLARPGVVGELGMCGRSFVREPGGLTVDQQRAYTCCAGPHRGGEEP